VYHNNDIQYSFQFLSNVVPNFPFIQHCEYIIDLPAMINKIPIDRYHDFEDQFQEEL